MVNLPVNDKRIYLATGLCGNLQVFLNFKPTLILCVDLRLKTGSMIYFGLLLFKVLIKQRAEATSESYD